MARRCSALRCLGVLTGDNGTGKTVCLKRLQAFPSKYGVEGKTAYFLAATTAGPTRGLKDFLADRGVKQAIHQKGISMKLLTKLAYRELQEKDIRMLLVDEADLIDTAALQGFVSLSDTCRDLRFPIAVLFSGVRDPSLWIGPIGAAESRTLQYARLSALTPELITAVFSGWGRPVAQLAEQVKAKDKDAIGTIRAIHRATKGNFRRLYFFARLAALEHGECRLTEEVVDEIFTKMARRT